jgi:hypothetical protein
MQTLMNLFGVPDREGITAVSYDQARGNCIDAKEESVLSEMLSDAVRPALCV